MENWIRENLSKCLDCVVTDKVMTAILAIKDDDTFDNYFGNLLSEDVPEHRLFLHNCRRMLLSGKQQRSDKVTKSQSSKETSQPPTTTTGSTSKKKTKFVSLYTSDGKEIGDTILLKGRHLCECQAVQHKLINNCMNCGRIVCEQEGSGPCLFCAEFVGTPEEEQRMQKSQSQVKNNKEQRKKSTTPDGKNSESLKKALAQRDRLLEYDRNSEKRTTVIDDEFDYFQEKSVWLSDAEREKFERLKQEMHDMKHASRANRKIKIDFAGREVDDDLPVSKEYEEKILREVAATNSASSSNWSTRIGRSEMALAPNLDVTQPFYKRSKDDANKSLAMKNDGLERIYNRVQDKELLEMQDMRMCLSMHQPWASLLVAGIKKHEGRVWYTEHRGRLWIASTTKEPHNEDVAEIEQFYRNRDPDVKFPKNYPTGRLLGCVNVENCLPQEEYRELYPNGESDSPYVFICTNPEVLPVLLPVQGEHKIYELPIKTHNAACKTLLRARTSKG